MKFILYVKSGCPWCTEAVGYLRDEGYAFEEIDVLRNPDDFKAMVEVSGQSLAPTLVADELVLPDFGVPELEAFLARHEITPDMVGSGGD